MNGTSYVDRFLQSSADKGSGGALIGHALVPQAPPPDPVECLIELVAVAEQHASPAAAAWIREAARQHLDHGEPPAAAFGLSASKQGADPPRVGYAFRRRNEALAELAHHFDGSGTTRARQVRERLEWFAPIYCAHRGGDIPADWTAEWRVLFQAFHFHELANRHRSTYDPLRPVDSMPGQKRIAEVCRCR